MLRLVLRMSFPSFSSFCSHVPSIENMCRTREALKSSERTKVARAFLVVTSRVVIGPPRFWALQIFGVFEQLEGNNWSARAQKNPLEKTGFRKEFALFETVSRKVRIFQPPDISRWFWVQILFLSVLWFRTSTAAFLKNKVTVQKVASRTLQQNQQSHFLVSNTITQMYVFHYLPELLFWEGMPLKIKDHEHLPWN